MINPARQNKFHTGIIAFLFLVSVCVWAVPAHASGDTLPPKARKAVTKGVAAAKIQDYELAIKYFKRAYESGGKDSPDVRLNLALAYDKAGGRELPAIAWYRAFLSTFSNKHPESIRDKRFESVRKRVIELDIEAESVVRRLIKIAEEAVMTFASEDRYGYDAIAEAQAAIGDLYAARESLRLVFQSQWDRHRSAWKRGFLGDACHQFNKNVVSIALSHWKHGDSKGAIKTIDWAVSNRSIKNPAGNELPSINPYRLEPLRMFINRDWRNQDSKKSDELLLFSNGIYFIGSGKQIRDGKIESFGGFGDSKWDELVRALYTYDEFFNKLMIMDKSCWGYRYNNSVLEIWTKVACFEWGGRWLPEFQFDQDWRTQKKKKESDDPRTTVGNIAGLARDMAQVLHFFRKFNAYHSTASYGWVW